EKLVGQRIPRREDPRLVTGQAIYVDDLRLPGLLAVMLLRSPHAHAHIRAIATARARALAGVVRVLTGADPRGRLGPVPCAGPAPAARPPLHPVLAWGGVGSRGEPRAVVVAESRAIAQDAVGLIEADLEPLPALIDPERALEPGAPLVHPALGTNLAARSQSG